MDFAIFFELVVFEGVVATAKHKTNDETVKVRKGFLQVHIPVIIIQWEIARTKVVVFDLDGLYPQAAHSPHETVEQEGPLALQEGLHHGHCEHHEPEVVGDVPAVCEAEISLIPWDEVVDHQDVIEPVLFAAVVLFELVEAGAAATQEVDEVHQEADHEGVQRK